MAQRPAACGQTGGYDLRKDRNQQAYSEHHDGKRDRDVQIVERHTRPPVALRGYHNGCGKLGEARVRTGTSQGGASGLLGRWACLNFRVDWWGEEIPSWGFGVRAGRAVVNHQGCGWLETSTTAAGT